MIKFYSSKFIGNKVILIKLSVLQTKELYVYLYIRLVCAIKYTSGFTLAYMCVYDTHTYTGILLMPYLLAD